MATLGVNRLKGNQGRLKTLLWDANRTKKSFSNLNMARIDMIVDTRDKGYTSKTVVKICNDYMELVKRFLFY
jgi:hypothetical protein